jgi:His-Xaa-Ser system radical SAM maturase HxsB
MNEIVKGKEREKGKRKFKSFDYYEDKETYNLLPFRFHRLKDQREVLVNDFGDFLIVPQNTVQKIVARTLSKEQDSELYGDLFANFFVSKNKIPELLEVLATRYRTKKSFLDYFTALHIFVISLRCEHTCHYCQVSRVSQDRNAFDMRKDYIDKGIDFMMKSPNPHVTMEFQGGESLLAFEQITYAVEKANAEATIYNKKITYVICTNLAPITDEILVFCRENNILISTSLDGPSFIHNQNRHRPEKNSYELAIEGIRRCREELGHDKVSALLTTTALSLSYPIEIVDEYFNQGFRSIFLRPISPYGFAVKNKRKNDYAMEDFLKFYKKAFERILEYNLKGEFFREDYATIILKKILTPFPVGYVDLQSPAGMINNVIVFNYDGKIYATDESRMLAEMQDFTFQLGDLTNNTYADIFYGEKALEISNSWSNECLPGCSECAFQPYCGADPVFNYAVQGDMVGYRPTSPFCEKNMEIIKYLLELIDKDKRIEKIFWTWVTGGN